MSDRLHKSKRSLSRRSSRNIKDVTIGTHVSSGRRSTKGVSSHSPGFSSSRRTARAKRGYVDQMQPQTRTRESAESYHKRVNRPHYLEQIQKKRRRRGIGVAVGIVCLVLIIVGAVGSFAYLSSVSGKMGLGDSNAKSSLAAQPANSPYYVLVVGEFSVPGQEYSGPDTIIAARVDETAKQVSLISIPANLQVKLSDGKTRSLSDAQLIGGDAALISAVNEFTGVSISHIVKVDSDGFKKLVDTVGGVTVQVAEEVDDPKAGDVFIPAGQQALDGDAALTFVRATNYVNGAEKRTKNQALFAAAFGLKVLETDAVHTVSALDRLADNIKTDWGATDVMAVADKLRGISTSAVYIAQVPGSIAVNTGTGVKTFTVSSTTWATMLAAFKAGQDPAAAVAVAGNADPKSFTVTVRNGSGGDGIAGQVANTLSAQNFQIAETGNAESFVYDETLVVYKDDAKQIAAETVASALGVGRAVASNGLYTFNTDVLVMVGKDWKPLN